MSHKAIFLDKDGTLITDVPYNIDPEKIAFTDRAFQALNLLHQVGYLLFIITNQSGIARGFFSELELNDLECRLRERLAEKGIPLSGFYYCPHDPNGVIKQYTIACNCRKPRPGLLFLAAEDHELDLSQSWFIGDILQDVEAGRAAGCRTILMNNGNETEWHLTLDRLPHHLVSNLLEAAMIILTFDRLKTGVDSI